MNNIKVENYDKDGNKIKPKEITLNHKFIYTLIKKYLKENN